MFGVGGRWEGIYVLLIYFVVQQKTTQHGKAIMLQLKGPQATGNPIFTFSKMTSSHSKLKQKFLILLLVRLPAFMRLIKS